MCTSSGSSGGYSQPSYGGSGGYGQPMQQSYGGPYGGFPGWGRPFQYSPNAGPAYQRPAWAGSLPDGYNPIPPTTPGGGGTTPPPPPYGGQDTRPPGTGAPTPPPPPYTGTDTRVTRPVNQPSWGAPQPYTNFPTYTQPGNLNSVGPAGPYPGSPAEGMQQPPTNPNTPPTQPPTNGRPPFAGQPKIGMQGRIISDNFDGSPSAQPQMLNAPTTAGVGMRDPNDNSPNLPQYAIGSQPPGGSPAPGLFDAEATGQGGGAFQPQDINPTLRSWWRWLGRLPELVRAEQRTP
jgi:hypothetical protein